MTLTPQSYVYPFALGSPLVTNTATHLRCNHHYARAVLAQWWDRAADAERLQVLAMAAGELHTWAAAMVRLALGGNDPVIRELGENQIEITIPLGNKPPIVKVALPGDSIDLFMTDATGRDSRKTVWPPQAGA